MKFTGIRVPGFVLDKHGCIVPDAKRLDISARLRQRASKRVRVVAPGAKLYGATRRNALDGPPAAGNFRAPHVAAKPETAASGHAAAGETHNQGGGDDDGLA
jgi:hypothetical protein